MRLSVRHSTHLHLCRAGARRHPAAARRRRRSFAGQTVLDWRIDVDCDARLREGRDGYGNITHMLYVDRPVRDATVTRVEPISSTSTLWASRGRVDVGVVAVALVGELLERGVLEVAHAEAEHAQEDAALGLGLDQLDRARPRSVTPTLKSPSVARMTRFVPPLMKFCDGDVVGELDARAAVGRAAGLQLLDAPRGSRPCAGTRSSGRTRPDAAGVDDDRDAVVLAELLDQQLQRRT